jgi:tetratricopeptide (TPR) repeat protein
LVCWRSHDRSLRLASFGVVWFFATLAPVLNAHWLGLNVFTERYLYLPSVGVAWLVGLGASKLWSRAATRPAQRWALVLAGSVVGGLCAARIVTRVPDWNNDKALYTRIMDLSPEAYGVQDALGAIYWHEGDLDKAESAWRRVLAQQPNDVTALNNLGLLARQRHQNAEAERFFQRALQARPRFAEAHLNLGDMYLKMGQRGPAELQLRAAIAISPADYRPHNRLGQILFDTGRPEEAEEQFRASIQSRPNALAYDFLGMFNIRRRALKEAARDFSSALGLEPSDSYAHFGLGDIYMFAGRKTEALRHYEAGLREDPTNPQALAAVQNLRQGGSGAAP